MKGTERQILELQKDLSDCLQYDIDDSNTVDTYDTAFYMVNKFNYQKIDKDSVVLSMDEWINFNKDHANELIKCAETEYEAGYKTGKSTMISEIKGILEDCAWDNSTMIVRALQDLIEKYGEKNVR